MLYAELRVFLDQTASMLGTEDFEVKFWRADAATGPLKIRPGLGSPENHVPPHNRSVNLPLVRDDDDYESESAPPVAPPPQHNVPW